MMLLFGHDKMVADWYSQKWGKPLQNWYYAIGILNSEGVLRGAATFHNFNGANIEMCYYGPGTMSRNVVKGLTFFLVNTLKVERLTVSVARRNKLLVNGLPKLGFKQEGVLRHFYGPYRNDDAIVFGMLSSEAKKFLK